MTKEKKEKKENKQIVEVHIYVHYVGVPTYTPPTTTTYPYTPPCSTYYNAGNGEIGTQG
jgi:hypothetical protein